MKQNWKAIIHGKSYEVVVDNGKYLLNGKPVNLDIAVAGAHEFSVIQEGKSYNAEVLEVNRAEKRIILSVNGNNYEVELKDKFDLLLQQMGMNKPASQTAGTLKAPMPGKVLRVDVNQGQLVRKGDSVLILEAMKMENAIKAPGEGRVKTVYVQAGDAVEKGEVMVEME